MISFGLTEEQEIVREAMAEFARSAMRPIARDCDEAEAIPQDFLDTAWQLGLTATQIPEAFGGGGEPRSPMTNALVLEELAHGDATLAVAAAVPSLAAWPLVEFGTPEQQQQHLPALCGESFPAYSVALVEPIAGFDPIGQRTVAERKGEGWVLSGTKSWVPLGERAEHFLVFARNGKGAGLDGIELFIVPRDTTGLTVSNDEKGLGLRAIGAARLDLERVELPGSARIGGDAGIDGRRLINASRAALSSVLVGLSRAVVETAIPYAKEREAFGEPIGRKQAIAFNLADMQIEVEAMRWMTWKTAAALEAGRDATREAHLARSYVARQAMKIADDGLQVFGGHGFIREYPLEMWYRNARTLGVVDGLAAL